MGQTRAEGARTGPVKEAPVRLVSPVQLGPRPRRWPWAVTAAVVGAAAGAGLVVALRRWLGEDAAGAQDPDDLRAVVDTGGNAALE